MGAVGDGRDKCPSLLTKLYTENKLLKYNTPFKSYFKNKRGLFQNENVCPFKA